jgi:hypothetical protein
MYNAPNATQSNFATSAPAEAQVRFEKMVQGVKDRVQLREDRELRVQID